MADNRMNDTGASSQPENLMMSDSSVVAVGESSTESEWLEVVRGEQSGVSLEIASKNAFSVGTDFANDIVLRSHQADPVELFIESHQGKRYIRLQQGQAWIGEAELSLEQWYELVAQTPVSFAEVSFLIKGQVSGGGAELDRTAKPSASSAKRSIAVAALVVGIALLGVLGAQEYWIADTHNSEPVLTLEQRIAELDLENIHIINDDTGEQAAIVQGRVVGREDFRRLQQMLTKQVPAVSIDVQIDSDIADAVHDIFRNHGIEAEIDVLGEGDVRVKTDGVDEQTMTSIEQALRSDLPMVHKIDIVNTPPDKPEPDNSAPIDPEKEIEAVVAGTVSYVITRDQARYFEGAVLPSGHTIESIEEGTVVMKRAGEVTQLKF